MERELANLDPSQPGGAVKYNQREFSWSGLCFELNLGGYCLSRVIENMESQSEGHC